MKILVAGASKSDLSIIKDALDKCDVLSARDSFDALRQIDAQGNIPLIIVDLDMPGMGAVRLLEALNVDSRKAVRVIALASLKDKKGALKSGAADCIEKPISVESVKIRVGLNLDLIVKQAYIQKIQENSLLYNAIFHQSPIGICISYSDSPFEAFKQGSVRINPAYEEITGRNTKDLESLGWAGITHPEDLSGEIENYKKLLSGEAKSYSMEKRFIRPDGTIVWAHVIVAPLTVLNQYKYNHICLVSDISQRKAIEKALVESERSKSVLLTHLPGMAYRCDYDPKWTMQIVSDGCYELTGYAPESLLHNKDLSFNDLILPGYRREIWDEWKRTLGESLPFNYEYEIVTASGLTKWVLEMGEGIYNEKGEVEALEGIIIDISNRKKMEEDLKFHGEHDTWTGLYNRRYLEMLLRKNSGKQDSKKAIISVNLNAAHLLNMTHGFHYSQDIIKKVAVCLNNYCDDKRLLFSMSEYRFVFYVKAYENKSELMAFCEAVAKTLKPLLGVKRIDWGIGIVEIDEFNRHDVDQLLRDLIVASENAVGNYRDNGFACCFFDQKMEAKLTREEQIKSELLQIVEAENDDSLFLEFQPIVDLKSNGIYGFEALARLYSKKLGLVPPLEFIPLADKSNVTIPLCEKIIHKALCFLKSLVQNGYNSIIVSINISSVHFLNENFTKGVFEKIEQMQVNPENIAIEITESLFASNHQKINSTLDELKSYGIKVFIDDFGTGYSSLARGRELNADCLKIDKFFIDKLLLVDEEEAITGDIISMAHKLGFFVIAEGVEHEKQRTYLEHFGCDKMQGYLISRPLNEKSAIRLLEDRR